MKLLHLGMCVGLLLPGWARAADAATPLEAMTEAVALRADLAAAVRDGTLKPGAALDQLRGSGTNAAFKLDGSAGFALAAIDVGHRLVAADRATEAEPFFREAESVLEEAVARLPDAQARLKAMYLRRLASLRSDYLQKPDQAKEDIERACALQPEDQYLQRVRERVINRRGDLLRNRPNK